MSDPKEVAGKEVASKAPTGNVNEIKAAKKVNGVDHSASVTFDFGGTVEGATKKFGPEVVYSNFVRASVITAQSAMRRMIETGKTEEEIVDAMKSWKPGVALERTIDPVASVLGKFGSMTAEEQKALIKQLQARANG